MKGLLRFVVAALAVVAAGGAAAQLTLYEQDGFYGRSVTVDRPVNDLVRYGFNDRASSVQVRGGSWQLCTDADFRGRCVTLGPGDYANLQDVGLDDRVSSVRVVATAPAPVPAPARGRGRILLYDYSGFGGRSIALDSDVVNFAQIGFNDRANSAVVEAGTWQVCENEGFQGSCMTLQPGRYPDLGGLAGRISSARVVGPGVAGPRPDERDRDRGTGRAVLFPEPELRGRPLVLDQPIARDLVNFNFNDRALSLRVESGYWLFCSDANFEGACRTFGPGSYPRLPPELRNSISSARRISNEYPYRETPNWRQ